MATARLTQALVRQASPAKSGARNLIWDTEVKGFGLQVTASGAKTFLFNYRNTEGVMRRRKIGEPPAWTVTAAKEEAKALRRRVARGEDPAAERQAQRKAPTVNDLCDRYCEEWLPKKRPTSAKEDVRQIDKYVRPRLGNRKVAAVRHRDVDALHRSLADMPYRANRLAALLSKMFALAMKWDWRQDNPVLGLQRYQEDRRERFLSQGEIVRLSETLDGWPNRAVADLVRFLLLTGCRKGEALSAAWGQVDLEAGVWVKPSAHTKQAKVHRVPLSAPALELLTARGPGEADELLFPGRGGVPVVQGLKRGWPAIRTQAGLEDVRLHDLRHSHASILASAGLSLPIIGAILGHTQVATTQRYAHLADSPLREAVERVGQVVTAAGKGKAADVVRLRKGAR